MDVLNEEEAMFESPLVDSYLTSPVTVSVCVCVCLSHACYSTHSCRNERGIVFHGLFLAVVWTVFLAAGCKGIGTEC